MDEQNIMSYDAFSFVRATAYKYIIKDENRKIKIKITYNKKSRTLPNKINIWITSLKSYICAETLTTGRMTP